MGFPGLESHVTNGIRSFSRMREDWKTELRTGVGEILRHCFAVTPELPVAVIADGHCPLAQALAGAYGDHLPQARRFDADAEDPESLREGLFAMSPGSLVVLVQSTRFELARYRLRLQLFQRGLRVAEHPHLQRVRPEELETFAASLRYDPAYYRRVGPALKARLDAAANVEVTGGADGADGMAGEGWTLRVDSTLEEAKTNLGDFAPWTGEGPAPASRLGGQFPLGEVFTEARDNEAVSGAAGVFAYADESFEVVGLGTPARLRVERGRVVGAEGAPDGLLRVLDRIRADEGEVWVRELGFGLNRAFTPTRRVLDIGAYERMCGVHLSLGAKHAVYPKPRFPREAGRHHVDVFLAAGSVRLDGETVYRRGEWVLQANPGERGPGGNSGSEEA